MPDAPCAFHDMHLMLVADHAPQAHHLLVRKLRFCLHAPPRMGESQPAALHLCSYLYAPFSRAHPSAKPQFANLPTERQMVMVRRLHVLLTRIMHGAFGFPPRFYIYWHPHDAALAFNQGGRGKGPPNQQRCFGRSLSCTF